MDDLVASFVPEERRDVLRVCALDLVEIGGRIAHESACDLRAVGADDSYAVADVEATVDRAHARRQQAPSAVRDRALGTGIEVERALGTERVRDPVLAVPERIAV